MAKVAKGKKQWYQIVAPNMFRNKVIGEVTLLEPDSFIGKTFSVNLMNITNDIRKQNTKVFFEASQFKDGKIHTKVRGYEMAPSSIKRIVRRGRNKISNSFVCRTSDGVHVRVKPIAITLSKVSSSVLQSLSSKIVKEVSKKVRETSFESLISNLINQRVQISWRDELKKVYPLRFFEVRSVKIEKTKRGLKEIPEVAEKKEVSETQGVSGDAQKASLSDKPKKEVKKEAKVEKPKEEIKEKSEEKKEAPKVEEKAEKVEPKAEEVKEKPVAEKVEAKSEVKEKTAVEG